MKDVVKDNYKLMFGDCLERMKEIPDGSVDLILTDPPYGTTQNKWDSVINLEDMWKEVWRVLKPIGDCVLFSAQPYTSILVTSQIKFYKYEWVWVKNLKTGNLWDISTIQKNQLLILLSSI